MQDAYTQNELALQSLKLAVEFLVPNGVFVTKVFRSRDYNALLWVFSQLFDKVEVTKPPSSRNVSAETFVVCRGFKAPRRIDPKFLNPKYVFKELDVTSSITGDDKTVASQAENKASDDPKVTTSKDLASSARLAHNAHDNVFNPETRKRKREGYEDGAILLHKTASSREFILASDPVGILGTFNAMTLPPPSAAGNAPDLASKNETPPGQARFNLSDIKVLDGVIASSEATTSEIRSLTEDLNVLGKGDFKRLLKWRSLIRQEIGLELTAEQKIAINEAKAQAEEEAEKARLANMNEDQVLDEEMRRLHAERLAELRKSRKHRNEAKNKELLRLQLKMGTPMDLADDVKDEALAGGDRATDVFNLDEEERVKRTKDGQKRVDKADMDELLSEEEASSDSESEEEEEPLDSDEEREHKLARLEQEADGGYEAWKQRKAEKDARFRAAEAKRKDKNRANEDEEWYGIKSGSDKESGDEEDDDDKDRSGYAGQMARKALEETYDSDDAEDEEDELAARVEAMRAAQSKEEASEKRRRAKAEAADAITSQPLVTDLQDPRKKKAAMSREANLWFANPLFQDLDKFDAQEADKEQDADTEQSGSSDDDGGEAEEDEELLDSESSEEGAEESTPASEDDDNDFEVVPRAPDFQPSAGEWAFEDSDEDQAKERLIQQRGLTTAEAVQLARQLVNNEKTKTDLVDEGFNKRAFADKEGLPSWFLEDEAKNYKANIPITKEAVEAIRAKQRALDARPVKKVAEAKARKKMRALRRLETARKRAEGIVAEDSAANGELNEREKAGSVKKILDKASKKQRGSEIKTVVSRGANRGLAGRPKGVKGRYRMVDSRGKKELRAQKRRDKKAGKKVSSSSSKNRTPNGYGRRQG